MGVPSFYRWLVNKYPKIVVNAIEEKEEKIETSLVNPNGIEYDNLYLDMNGIIHPCFHPDDHPSPPKTFQEVFNNICEYIDRLFSIVRPRKLLYMAIDGVAPRAKMNQQRTRRFRTAKDNEIAEAEENRLRKEFEMEGKQVLPKQESEVSDSNIITPGTVFMHELSIALQVYINQRLKDNVCWKGIKVILSDANVPGEGEHKIMSFIRLQSACPDYDPNTHHCLYGLDADLIMLALATHELHFSILREDVLIQEQQPASELVLETSLRQADSGLPGSQGWFQQRHQSIGGKSSLIKKPYQFLHIWILREYIELDLKISDPPQNIKIDLERIIDDFIFMCIFTGNDFLPHMPTLSIHEGAIDLLMHVYKDEFKNLGGYLVDMQWVGDKKARYIKLKRVEKFILLVGAYEERIFMKRSELRDRKLRRLLSEASEIQEEQEEDLGFDLEVNGRNSHGAANGKSPISKNLRIKSASSNGAANSTCDISEILQNTKELKEKLKKYIRDKSDLFKSGSFGVDKVRLGSIGWKERYYKEKFCTESKEDMENMRKAMVQKYTEGLCWVLQYYFSGVPSWTWFYPYHYSPFASDVRGLSQVKVIFQKGSPFKPFYQLMGVLPPRSAHALPRAFRALMTSEESEIIDFYPTDFEFDEDGKRFMWQAICKLPFIDEERLLSQMKKLVAELGVDEELRNSTKVDYLFVRSSNVLQSQIFSLHEKQCAGKRIEMVKESIDKNFKCGISGFISPREDKDSRNDNVLCVLYELPNGCQHIPRPLEGVQPPEKTINDADIVETQLWHECQGSRPNYRAQIHGFHRRAQIQGFHRNAINGAKSSPELIHKGAGSGWGAGRGKRKDNIYHGSSEHTGSSTNFPVGHGERLDHDIGDLRISDSRQGFKSYGRAQSVNTNLWPSRNSPMSAPPCGQGLTVNTSHTWQRNQSPVANPSMQAHGRGLYIPVWQQNQSPVANPSMQAHGRGRYIPVWQRNQSPVANPSMQAHGRGLYIPVWQQNQSPVANPSMQAHGRGRYIPVWQRNQSPVASPSMQAWKSPIHSKPVELEGHKDLFH
ncbi:5'-3' exoribonuclease 3-like isoform X2 [Camellia sinensis]|uniref:5'-3' exoribonuclease 3-like isoform X2 n=1 Tax=Camellia sinensis TaxID=4442 RepID=UPI0010357690|nr:5'-3' exoribonuclease 3-like isoform X2 [Camellia sinensis]